MLRSDLLEHFKKFDTPTICNALELIDSRFRLHGFTTEQMVCADPSLPPIVGYARTATLRALSPVDPISEVFWRVQIPCLRLFLSSFPAVPA